MAPGLTAYTAKMAFLYFALIGWWPAVALIRIWQPRTAIKLLCALFPAALALAAIVAGMEEYLFIQKHRANGIGPTARWTVSNHWLAYDHHRQQLTGSD